MVDPVWHMRQVTLPIEKSFSVYLDLARFIAALLVLAAHYLQHGVFGPPLTAILPDFGREAVIVFFVLSGFVIAYTTEQKNQTARAYVLARAVRIYSVALPVLLLAFAVTALAAMYGVQSADVYQLHKPWLYIPFHLLFAGELWNLSEIPPWLIPYWSLGYEVWYYVLFGVLYYLRGATRLIVAAAVLAVVGHKLWLLLPVWLSGVWLYQWQKTHAIDQRLARFGWCLTLVLLAAFKAARADHSLRMLGIDIWPFPALHLGSADRFLADYVVCALVFVNFLCARFAGFGGLARLAGPVRKLAAHTFTLYMSHFIVICAWLALYPHDPSSALDIAALTLLVALVTIALSALTEGRKDWFRARLGLGLAAVKH
jgi:peptidoglycan/LPS O-acetylase OafA/YrhL